MRTMFFLPQSQWCLRGARSVCCYTSAERWCLLLRRWETTEKSNLILRVFPIQNERPHNQGSCWVVHLWVSSRHLWQKEEHNNYKPVSKQTSKLGEQNQKGTKSFLLAQVGFWCFTCFKEGYFDTWSKISWVLDAGCFNNKHRSCDLRKT